jgi:hypothetical protein
VTRMLDGLEAILRAHLLKEDEVYVPLLARLSAPDRGELAAALADHAARREAR